MQEDASESVLLTASAKLAETEVRRILRRVTAPASKKEAKTTMKPLGRMLAKIAHANPLPVAEQLLRQVTGMPGMVRSIAASLAFLTPAAFDVLTFALLRALASPRRKLKEDGVNLEEWFQWLAAFTGVLCKAHGAAVEVAALLQYVANQLKGCEGLDLLVLKEIVGTMTGVRAVFEVSGAQLDALAGSETLIHEAVTQGEMRAGDRSLRAGASRLLAALRSGPPEQQLAGPLLVLLAQQRRLIAIQPGATHLKLVAEELDKCHETTVQYAEFLRGALPPGEYMALLPPLEEMVVDYGIEADLALELHRPLMRGVTPPAAPATVAHGRDDETLKDVEAEVGGGKAETDGEEGEIESAGRQPIEEEENGEAVGGVSGAGGGGAGWPKLQRQLAALAPPGGFQAMTLPLFATFWSLTLYDLEVPATRYESTLTTLRSSIRAARDDLEVARRETQQVQRTAAYAAAGAGGPGPAGGPGGWDDPTGGIVADAEQLSKDIERWEAAAARLPGDLQAQRANAIAIDARLRAECGSWAAAPEDTSLHVVLVREFLQHCLLPRALSSPSDAIYCARFLEVVRKLDAPGFRLLNLVDRVLREAGFLVRCVTPREATNLGIFLGEMLGLVRAWRVSPLWVFDGIQCVLWGLCLYIFKPNQTQPNPLYCRPPGCMLLSVPTPAPF
jgi:THO complex subunit 2